VVVVPPESPGSVLVLVITPFKEAAYLTPVAVLEKALVERATPPAIASAKAVEKAGVPDSVTVELVASIVPPFWAL
jgi:hypothetical protein